MLGLFMPVFLPFLNIWFVKNTNCDFIIDFICEKCAICGLNLLIFFCMIRKIYEEKRIGNFGFFAFL